MAEASERELLKEALVKIRSLRSEVATLRQAAREPVAIVGAGCRFPGGASDLERYWELLSGGVDAVREVPPGRWNVGRFYDSDPDAPGKSYLREGGFLDDIESFDAAFFGISPREAVQMDPQQRLLLEVAWEAIENAGIAADRLSGSATGVFVGMMTPDYAFRQVHQLRPSTIDPYMLTGNDFSCPAGRLAYVLGLQGPAMVVATACSSSLVSLHLACQALRAGECELALAGGVNLVLDPVSNIMLSRLRALARDGRCKTFDAAADGYGRGEGCGVMVLERVSDAVAHGHRILAVIRGSAVNHDGRSAGLTVPNGPAQEKLLRRALEIAGVSPAEVSYVEAHGTGTPLGDPIEIRSLARVFGADRIQPLLVGSVKTNLGHLEAAAGAAGVLKVALALQHGSLPAHLHFDTPNPHIPWHEVPIEIVREQRPWTPPSGRRLAGVSAFGLSGVNAHVVLEAAPVAAAREEPAALPSRLLTITAATRAALREQVSRYQEFLGRNPGADWADVCFTAHQGRAHFPFRVAVAAGSATEALAGLGAASIRRMNPEFRAGFVFPGAGNLYAGMGRQLYALQPVFREAVDRCAAALRTAGGWNVRDWFDAGAAPASTWERPAALGVLFSVQCGLASLWRAWGIEPARVMAEGAGVFAAAVTAGVFPVEGAARLLAVHAALPSPTRVEVPLRAGAAAGAGTGVSVAAPAAVAAAISDVQFTPPRIPVVAGRTGLALDHEVVRPGYWLLWEDESSREPSPSHAAALPGWIHLRMGDGTDDAGHAGQASLRPGNEWRALLEALSHCYRAGASPDWNAVDQPGASAFRLVTLPTYAFQRERYWALDDPTEEPEPDRVPLSAARLREGEIIGPDGHPPQPSTAPQATIDADLLPRLRALDEPLRLPLILKAIAVRTAAVLRLSTEPESDAVLLDLGLDSLMAVELKAWIGAQFQCETELSLLLSGATIQAVAAQVGAAVAAAFTTASKARMAASGPQPERNPAAALEGAASEHSLSYGQKALWFIHQSDPESAAYNIGVALQIREDVEPAFLCRSFELLCARHDSLRAQFTSRDGDPVRTTSTGAPFQFQQVDASAWTGEQLRDQVASSHRAAFDPATGPLLRIALFTRGDAPQILLLSLHHIAGDALSFWTLLQELEILYPALLAGQPARLPAPSVSYSDFVAWQKAMLAGPEGERLWQFWSTQLAGELPVLALPTDHPRPAVQSFHGSSYLLQIPPSLTQRLRQLARTARTTLYALLLAAFDVLLYRFSGQADIIVGSATAGRPSQFNGVVGYFTNPVAIRADLSGNPSFLDLVDQVRRTSLAAIEHQHYPFPLLVERLQPRRDPSRSPIFQADFALLKNPPVYRRGASADGSAAPLVRAPFEFPEEEGQFDLSLHVTEEDESLRAAFKFNTALFEPATVARLAACYETLLGAIADDPQQHIDVLPLLSPDERERVLALGRGAVLPVPILGAHQLFGLQAERTPEAIAAEMFAPGAENGASFSYAELRRGANRLAHHLQSLGLGADQLVGVCLERSLPLVTAILGVLTSGAAYLPLDPAYPRERLAFMMSDAAIPVLLTTSVIAGRLSVPDGVRVICLDQPPPRLATYPETAPQVQVSPDHLAYVIYTSGSTGAPKGAMITHRGLTNYLLWALDAYRVGEGAGAPVNTSISFDATITSFLLPLVAGRRVLLLPEENVIESLAAVLRRRAHFSLVKLTPAHLEALSALLDGEELDGCAHSFIIGGEALRGDMLRFWQHSTPSTRLINEYGPTETVVGCSIHEVDGPVAGPVSIGHAIANTRLYVLDRRGQAVPQGVAGELYIGGEGVARGYLRRPELTAERFVPDPFGGTGGRLYRSGDIARFQADGQLEFLGRADGQVKIRGYRIEPGEIESRLLQHPRIREAVVDTVEDSAGSRQLAAWFVAVGPAPRAEECVGWLAETLPQYMIPGHFAPLERFPLTPNGKVDRRALPDPSAPAAPARQLAPRDPVEMKLIALWEDVLNVRPIGVRDDFFSLGGHSLLAVRLMTRIQKEFSASIPLAAILRGPTVEQLARTLRERSRNASAHPSLVLIRPGAHTRPFFCVPGAGGNVLYLYNLARSLDSDQAFYGLQGAGLDGEAPPHTSVEEMAAYYLEAVRQVQPRGPYVLGGHSLGGWAAFEMAQQLRQQGEEVALVAIVDTAVPVPPTGLEEDRSRWDQARWIAELTSRIAQLLRPELMLEAEQLRTLDANAQLDCFRNALVQADLFPGEADTGHLRHVVEVFRAHSQVRYQLPDHPLPVPIALLRTPALPPHAAAIADDPAWGWGVCGPVDVHHVPGAHLSVLREPFVRELAAHLAACLG